MAVLLRTEEDAGDESGWRKPWSVALVNRRARRPPLPPPALQGSPAAAGAACVADTQPIRPQQAGLTGEIGDTAGGLGRLHSRALFRG